MQFKITNKKDKTSQSTGNAYVSATLTDTEGKEYVGINAFNGEFDGKDSWEGELKQNGNYYNLQSPKQASGGAFKSRETERLMDKKETSIRGFQDSKEYAVRTASTMSGAVAMAVAQFTNKNDLNTLEELVEKYRRFLWDHWQDTDKFPPFN